MDLSEEGIKENCPHCNFQPFAYKYPLYETDNFWIICDVHPLTEGHILIIPKKHLYYKKISSFLKDKYDSVASFEHGKIGQTIFHSHVHLLPFKGGVKTIIPEAKQYLTQLRSIEKLKDVYKKDNQYLFLSIGDKLWTVDVKLGKPRFFRDRFAKALGKPERGNWKEMRQDKKIMKNALKEIKRLQGKWKQAI